MPKWMIEFVGIFGAIFDAIQLFENGSSGIWNFICER
jgi:hypothetical protein